MSKEDSWLRLFNSELFDEWLALSYIHAKPTGGVHEYLCNRLFELSDEAVERILSQLCELAVNGPNPSSSVQRTLIGLAGRSTRNALKMYWLLRTMSNDSNPKLAKIIVPLLQSCHHAATAPKLAPSQSPMGARTGSTPGASSQNPINDTRTLRRHTTSVVIPSSGPCEALSQRSDTSQPIASSSSSPISAASPHPNLASDPSSQRLSQIHKQLGSGEGVSQLVRASMDDLQLGGRGVVSRDPPTDLSGSGVDSAADCFVATMEFFNRLCSCASTLTPVHTARRASVLRQRLESINERLHSPELKGKVLWPMGGCDKVLLRLVPDRSVILNSRERTPFLLFVETMELVDSDSGDQEWPVPCTPPNVPTTPTSIAAATPFLSSSPANTSPPLNVPPLPTAFFTAMDSRSSSIADPATGAIPSISPSLTARHLSAHNAACGSPEGHFSTRSLDTDPGPIERVPSAEALQRMVSSMLVSELPEPRGRGLRMTMCEPCDSVPHSRSSSALPPSDAASARGPGEPEPPLEGRGSADSAQIAAALAEASPRDPRPGRPPRPQFPDRRGLSSQHLPVAAAASAPVSDADSSPSPTDSRPGVQPAPGDPAAATAAAAAALPLTSTPVPAFGSPARSSASPLAQTRSHNSTECSAGSWVNVEAGGGHEVMSAHDADASKAFPQGRGLEANGGAASTEGIAGAHAVGGAAEQKGGGGSPLPGGKGSGGSSTRAKRGACQQLTEEQLSVMERSEYVRHVYGAMLADVVEHIRCGSPYGRTPSWQCSAVIVKSGDDCRQELLAIQLISAFKSIFDMEGLPLWLHAYEVLPTSHQTALIELLPNCVSVHSIKRCLPPETSLSTHFFRLFPKGTDACARAQRAFVSSLAAYSLVCYFLQIKDRHDANIMFDTEGHLIHIDFGFMLSNSPGGVSFERAPFKLTAEYMEIMDSDIHGSPSSAYNSFVELWKLGFKAAAKHSERVVQLVEMMLGSGCPCFVAGKRAVEGMRRRFRAEPAAAIKLVSDSVDAWTTRQYDHYQRALNGIL